MEPNARAINAASEYALSKESYYADFFTVPFATSVALVWLFSLHTVSPIIFGAAVVVGFIAWTFLEYVIHRWFLHRAGAKEHRFHHIYPAVFGGARPLTTAIIGAFGFFALVGAFGAVIGVGLLVGLVFGYLAYFAAHDKMHHGRVKSGTYLAKLNAAHDLHHRKYGVNYGVLTPFWDIVFGTYAVNTARPRNEF